MLGEAVGELFVVVFRFVFRILSEVLIEFLLKGTGYLICRIFSKKINPDGWRVCIVGLIFWALMFITALEIFNFVDIDRCLDSGGSYNYETSECVN